jgi:hypothetical protein
MTNRNLSPAAQAVLDALYMEELNGPQQMMARAHAAAALRAAADHIDHDWSAFNCIDSLYEIADELENTND